MGARKSDQRTTLVTIPFSHACEKARWALDRAGVDYVEEPHLPPACRRRAKEAGGSGTVPVLFFDTATRTDSKQIVQWVDERQLETRRLFPSDRALLAEVEAFADRLDREYAAAVRRLVFAAYLEQPGAFLRVARRRAPWLEGLLLQLRLGTATRQLREQLDLSPGALSAAETTVEQVLSEVDALLSDGRRYLFGGQFTAADLGFAAYTAPLVLPPQHPGGMDRPEDAPASFSARVQRVRARAAGAYVLRLYETERRASAV